MSIDELEKQIARTDLDAHTKQVYKDVLLQMRVYNLDDSSKVDKQVLVSLIQKEPIAP